VLTHRQLIDIEMFTKDGKTIWTEVSFSFRYNENQEVEIIGVGRDVSDRKLAQQQLQYITFHDSLTGLYNRAFYEEELSRLYVKRNLPLSLILADINDLKLTNDAFGHLEGDKLIQEFASILQEITREDDIVARIGGDEFVLLLPKTNELETQTIVNRINQAIAKSSGSKLLLSVAMGSMTTHEDTDDFTKLFTVAEDDMYKHKLRNKEDQTEDIVEIIQQSFKVKYPKYYQLCKDTADYAVALAKSLMLPEQETNNVFYGSLFSLIGTLKEPDISIKDQPKLVVENGYHLLKQVPGFRDVADIVLSIFERVDGKGTPKGLINDEIPRAAKIIRIALDFCRIKDETQLSNEKVIELLQPNVGIVYDKNLFSYFRLIEEEKAEHETI
jgi:diguanylate cyclase (GGDEF)-like protein